MKIDKIILTLAACAFCIAANAQEKRYPIYLNAGFEKEFLPYLSAGLDLEGRFCNATSTQKLLIKPFVEFSPIKYFSLGAEYRWNMTHDNGEDPATTDWQQRLGIYAKGKYAFYGFKLEARVKFCNYSGDYSYWDTDSKTYIEDETERYLRFKIQAGYKIKPIKLTPYFSYEIFDNLTMGKVDKLRYTFGLKKKLSKQHTIGFEYMLEQKFNRYSKKGKVKDDIHNNVFAFSYKFTLPYKQKSQE